MKKLSSVLFVSLLSLAAACGGDRSSTPTSQRSILSYAPPMAPIVQPDAMPIVDVVPAVKSETPVVAKVEAKADGRDAEIEKYEAMVKANRKDASPHIELARVYIEMNEKAKAIKEAQKSIKLAPESSRAYNTLGRAELLRHGYDAAIVAFTKSAELDPTNVWAWNNLGFTQLELKDYTKAIAALSEAVKLPGATGFMFNNLGTAYEHLDMLDDARDAFESGGKLGSVAALSSRKRLDGVDSVVAVAKAPVIAKPTEYDTQEETPEPMAPVEDTRSDSDEQKGDEAKVDDTKVDAPKVEEPKVDATKVDAPMPKTI
ncbi:MAG TPA: tetratricopeptide repeat protein [Kofleriaceae bacterium]|jgi:Flp pilus assembly protein TadD